MATLDPIPGSTRSADLVGVDPDLITLTHVIYGLHAASLAIGIVGSATIVGAFLFGIPSIVAVILNYARRSEVRGTFLESHFRWQIRTFWFALLWACTIFIAGLPLTLIIVGFAIWAVGLFLLGIWAIYRITRGWIALRDHHAIAA